MKAVVSWRMVAAIVLPVVLQSLYLYFSRWPVRWFNATSDWLALAISLSVGAALLATKPMSTLARTVALVMYFPLAGIILLYFTFVFIAIVFGDAS